MQYIYNYIYNVCIYIYILICMQYMYIYTNTHYIYIYTNEVPSIRFQTFLYRYLKLSLILENSVCHCYTFYEMTDRFL